MKINETTTTGAVVKGKFESVITQLGDATVVAMAQPQFLKLPETRKEDAQQCAMFFHTLAPNPAVLTFDQLETNYPFYSQFDHSEGTFITDDRPLVLQYANNESPRHPRLVQRSMYQLDNGVHIAVFTSLYSADMVAEIAFVTKSEDPDYPQGKVVLGRIGRFD